MTLHQLVIRNLAVLEQAPAIAEEIDDSVLHAIEGRVRDWASARSGWWVTPDNDKEFCQFGPPGWPHDQDKDEHKAFYTFGYDPKYEDKFEYLISGLTGAVPFEVGIWFKVDASWITHRTGKGTRPQRAWQQFLALQVAERQHLQSNGFGLADGSLFLPVHLVADDLANAYPDALSDALAPLDDALNKLAEAHPEIDAIVKAAELEFRVPQP